jgi:putative DNA primase/helicase
MARAVEYRTKIDVKDTVRCALDAAAGYSNGGNTYGFPMLAEYFGERVVKKLAEWLGFKGSQTVEEAGGVSDSAATNPSTSFTASAAAVSTQDRLALQFAEANATRLRYVAPLGKWFTWGGNVWKRDEEHKTFNEIRNHVRAYEAELKARPRDDGGNKRLAIVSVDLISNIDKLARADRRLSASVDQWDKDNYLLNTPEGIIDLRDGSMRKAKANDFCLKMTSLSPAPAGTDCPKFKAFLLKSMDNRASLVAYMQRALGYTLTGDITEHAMFFHHGEGANGKSVLLSTTAKIMGGYHKTASMELFVVSHHAQHLTFTAALHGARMVSVSETEEGRQWRKRS